MFNTDLKIKNTLSWYDKVCKSYKIIYNSVLFACVFYVKKQINIKDFEILTK